METHVMRRFPHPLRVLWKSALLVAYASMTLLVMLALGSGSSMSLRSLLAQLAWVVTVSYLVAALVARHANAIDAVVRMWSGTASVFIARPPAEVWRFIRPAETTPMITPTARRGFTVPGTPDGIGEQQCFVSDAPLGQLQAGIVEVIDEQPGRLAVVHNVTGPP